jgi:pimeloyl-ACP methyl ester carboxylesterase
LFIQIENLRLHYQVNGEGPNLLFLPGWGADINNYKSLLDNLKNKFRVYALDLPGTGLSSGLERIYATEDYVKIVYQFIEASKIAPVIIVGHSLGGKISLLLTAKHPALVKKLVLMSSAGVRAKKTLKMFGKIYFYKICKLILRIPGFKNLFANAIDNYKNKAGSSDYKNASGIMRATLVRLVNEDFRKALPAITVPTLLIWGDQDTSTALASGKLMAAAIPNSKLIIVNGADHFPYLHNLTLCLKSIEEFLL